MKSIVLNLLTVSFFMCSCILFSQEKKSTQRTSQPSPNGIIRCLSDEYNAELLKKHPNMMGSPAFEKKLQNIIKDRKTSKLQSINGVTLVRIPVVVHVIHNGTAMGTGANISDAQVLSQIQVLNEDYRRILNTNGYNTHDDGADTNIEFFLAKESPDGCTTTGIERYDLSNISTTWSSDTNGNIELTLKPMTIWDSSKYLNMWTVTFDPVSNSDLLGYAQGPGGPSETDGVVMGYQYFGSNDAPGVTIPGDYNLGRTTTHEVGHFLGLFHTFQSGCADGDFCDDTPATAQENYGCPIDQDSCPVGNGDGVFDMVENYMDYTDDSCMNIFTIDQSARMDGVLSGARQSLADSTVPDELPSVIYDSSIKILDLNLDSCTSSLTPEIELTNYGTITLTSATISYNLNNGTPIIHNWSGSLIEGASQIITLQSLSTPSGSNDFNVAVSQSNTDLRTCNDTDSGNFVGVNYASAVTINLTLNTDSYADETSWEFGPIGNPTLYTSPEYDNSNNDKTYDYVFNVSPNECYTFKIIDAYGDGLCCAKNGGEGSYELRTNDDTLIRIGGLFGYSESTEISTTTLSVDNYFMENDISLYPNPTSTDITIKVSTINDLPNNIQVYNILGQNLLSKRISTAEDLKINASNLSKGMYFIRITKDYASITLPFIKK
jgi:hypothetical protein